MTVTVEQVSPYYYAVKVDDTVQGYTFSHPRCLPRSWSVRWADGTGPFNGTEATEWFRTRKKAVAWIEARAHPCKACGAKANEDCSSSCVAWPRNNNNA